VSNPPTILVFDSGLGGLTVLREIVKARPDAQFSGVENAPARPRPYARSEAEHPPAAQQQVAGSFPGHGINDESVLYQQWEHFSWRPRERPRTAAARARPVSSRVFRRKRLRTPYRPAVARP